MSPPPASLSSHRVPALDGVRGVAILLVMLHHLTPEAKPLPEGLSGMAPILEAIRVGASGGWAGVDLFFVLSGFLITGILYDAKGTPNFFRNFYARRALRIFPLYYLFLAATTLAVQDFHWSYWLYAQSYWMPHGGPLQLPLVHTWSLAVEEQFYLVWPVVVWLTSRRTLLWTCAALVLLAPALRGLLVAGGVDPYAIYFAAPARMDALALGGFVALCARGERGLAPLVPVARAGALAAGLALPAVVLWQGSFHAQGTPMLTLGFSLLGLGFASGLVLVLTGRPRRLLTAPWLRAFGRYSYAIYLVHMVIARTLWHWILPEDPSLRRDPSLGGVGSYLLYVGATVAASFAAGAASWHLFEKRWLRLKERVPMGGTPGADEIDEPRRREEAPDGVPHSP